MNHPILILDDRYEVADLIKVFLQKANYDDILISECPMEALKLIKEGTEPSLIITDYFMPLMDGLSFLIEVFKIKKIPSIIMSGDPESVPKGHSLMIIEKGRIDFIHQLIKQIPIVMAKKDEIFLDMPLLFESSENQYKQNCVNFTPSYNKFFGF